MAALQHSWLSSLNTTLLFSSKHQKNSPFKLSFSQNQPSDEPVSLNSEETAPEYAQGPVVVDPVKLAFEKAKAYRKTKVNPDSSKTEQNPGEDAGGDVKRTDGSKEISSSVKVAMGETTGVLDGEGIIRSGTVLGILVFL